MTPPLGTALATTDSATREEVADLIDRMKLAASLAGTQITYRSLQLKANYIYLTSRNIVRMAYRLLPRAHRFPRLMIALSPHQAALIETNDIGNYLYRYIPPVCRSAR